MNYRVLGSVMAAAAIAFAQPVAYVAQEVHKAADIIAAARKAIGGGAVRLPRRGRIRRRQDRKSVV